MSTLTCSALPLENLDKQKIWWLGNEGADQGGTLSGQAGWESEAGSRRPSPWSAPLPQWASATKAPLPSLVKCFPKCGGSPCPLLPSALCRHHILHRALSLQVRSSCCPLVPPPRPGWGSCDTSLSCPLARDPRVSWRKGFCLLSPVRCISNPLFKELVLSLLKHAACPSLQTKFPLPDHCQSDTPFLSSVHDYYFSSFRLRVKLFGLLTGMLSCFGKRSRDEMRAFVMEESVIRSWLFQAGV